MELWELSARESIRELVARYNGWGDTGRFDPMLELFAEDAVMCVPPDRVLHGREEIRALFTATARRTGRHKGARTTLVRHFTATHQIDLQSRTTAMGRAYYLVLTDRGLDHWGRYIDEYRRVSGRWVFQRRRVTVDGRAPGAVWGEASERPRRRSRS
ncbi:MAG: nuclear transport factor 2 family protein [Myxococcota bacterium]